MSEKKRAKPRRHIVPLFKSVPTGSAGSVPGSPVYIGDKAPTEAAFSLIQYSHDEISFVTPENIEEVLAMLEDGMVNWVNVNGLADQDAVEFFAAHPAGSVFGISGMSGVAFSWVTFFWRDKRK